MMLREFLEYLLAHPGVGFTTCIDHVRKWREGKIPGLPNDAG